VKHDAGQKINGAHVFTYLLSYLLRQPTEQINDSSSHGVCV